MHSNERIEDTLRNAIENGYPQPLELPAQVSNRSCLSWHVDTGNHGSYVWLDAVANRVPVKGGIVR